MKNDEARLRQLHSYNESRRKIIDLKYEEENRRTDFSKLPLSTHQHSPDPLTIYTEELRNRTRKPSTIPLTMTQPETSDIDGIISAEDLIEVSSGGLRFIPNDTPTIAQQLWGLYCSDCIHLKIQIEEQCWLLTKLETTLDLAKKNLDTSTTLFAVRKEEIQKKLEEAKKVLREADTIRKTKLDEENPKIKTSDDHEPLFTSPPDPSPSQPLDVRLIIKQAVRFLTDEEKQ